MCLQSEHMCEISLHLSPCLNHTMPDLVDHVGLFITVTQTYIQMAAILASKSQINLQMETRSRCERTWRTLLWSTFTIKSKMSYLKRTQYVNDSDLVTRVSHVGSCSL